MKKIILATAIIFMAFISQAQNKVTAQTDSFKVWGNCGMCEKKIEQAASKVKGVKKANWDKAKMMMSLTYNPSETDVLTVQKAIAAIGYDTEKVRATDKAYSKLDGCCQYEREK